MTRSVVRIFFIETVENSSVDVTTATVFLKAECNTHQGYS